MATKGNNVHGDRRSVAQKKVDFLASYAKFGTTAGAIRDSGVTFKMVEHWKERDAEFVQLCDESRKLFLARLENEAIRRGADGVLEGVYYKGERVDSVRKYSDSLLLFLLKANDPEKYRDSKMQIELITVDAIDAEIERLRQQLNQQARDSQPS